MIASEAQIKRHICEFLEARQRQIGLAMQFWLNETAGIRGRRRNGRFQRNGTSDIFLVLWGRFCVLEVKRPGEPHPDLQRAFIADIRQSGGRGAFVHSLEETREIFESWVKELTPF